VSELIDVVRVGKAWGDVRVARERVNAAGRAGEREAYRIHKAAAREALRTWRQVYREEYGVDPFGGPLEPEALDANAEQGV
jgi:hypothetical protein